MARDQARPGAVAGGPLPFVLDSEEAMKPGAPQLFEDGNLEGAPLTVIRGDVEIGLRESDHVIERVYHTPTMWSGSMEPHAVVAQWEAGRLTAWCSTQSPFRVHADLRWARIDLGVAEAGLSGARLR